MLPPFDPWFSFTVAADVAAASHAGVDALANRQARRLNELLAAAARGSRLYRRLLKGRDPAGLRLGDLPIMRKADLMLPSAAVLLAEERLAGRLEIAPQEMWTGGETLSRAMRAFVQQAFGCPVVNSYGASEFLSLASECLHGCLHLNSDWVILESVDDRGRPVPAGESGATTLLTNLANHVQPLIRYDLGDCLTLHSKGCACGSHLPVVEVLGRNDDTLRLDRPGARAVLAASLAQQGAAGVQIRCRSGQPGRRGRSGKVQRVIAPLL